jgi:hypothetical protein
MITTNLLPQRCRLISFDDDDRPYASSTTSTVGIGRSDPFVEELDDRPGSPCLPPHQTR